MDYIVYVKIDKSNYITTVNSSAFLTDITDWVEIDRGHGDKYHHAQGNYFPQPIITMNGAYCYKLVDGNVVPCTAEEIATQESVLAEVTQQPTQLDIIEAKVTYIAMMAGLTEVV